MIERMPDNVSKYCSDRVIQVKSYFSTLHFMFIELNYELHPCQFGFPYKMGNIKILLQAHSENFN